MCFGDNNSGFRNLYYGAFDARHTQHTSVDYLNMLPDYFYTGGCCVSNQFNIVTLRLYTARYTLDNHIFKPYCFYEIFAYF